MVTGLLILFPLLCLLALLGLKEGKWIKIIALAGSGIEFLISLVALYIFVTQCHCQLKLNLAWLPDLGINFSFAMDGISMLLVLLTTFLTPIIIAASSQAGYKNPSSFYALILLMETAFIGVFTATDGMMFYIFWELALIPAYFITAIWGGHDRIRITFKFFIYTFSGSLLMLVALIWLYFHTPFPHSFSLAALYQVRSDPSTQTLLFVAFFLAFAIKIPIFPFHTWQPDTYTEAPAGGTMVLSGIMLKMGLYGMIRLVLPICPTALREYGMWAMILAVSGIVYASVIAIRQSDLKRLVAYSSIAHVGLIAAGILAARIISLEGATIQMVSHGINIVGLFFMISIIEDRTRTRSIASLGGIAISAPWFAAFFLVILLGTIALPLTNGFIGEFLLLLGIFQWNPWVGGIAGLTIILGAVYMLWMYQRTMLGRESEDTHQFRDLTRREIFILTPLVIMIFWIGLFPSFFLNIVGPAIWEIIYIMH